MSVAVIAFNRISPFHLSVPCLVFGKDRRVGDSPWFDLVVCAGEEGVLVTNAGFAIHCDNGLDQVAGADIVIVPSWRDVTETPPTALLETLQAAYARGALVVGLCLGAFVLAHAGLLSDKRATTHWAWAAHLARDFPRIEVDPKVLYVEVEQILTSAGVAAGLDCCIHIVRRIYGRGVANALARQLLVSPHRDGGQAQFISQPVPQGASDQRLGQLLDWLRANLGQPLSIDQVATRLAMSRRSFTRHFKQLTGSTFGKWLTNERIKAAQLQLETTDHSIETIAGTCGFGTSLSLRQHFFSIVGVSPTTYRKAYQR
ncbi:GlxA family transcriptional regulator [Pseudomonas yamanorum]|uniref:GlxA family transcriptional regulator n=1 Tax=Pseudomonas yamanorum TaxID=515393 RepID=UPI00384C40A1